MDSCNLFEDRIPVDEIYKCGYAPTSIEFQWLDLRIMHQDNSTSNGHQIYMHDL